MEYLRDVGRGLFEDSGCYFPLKRVFQQPQHAVNDDDDKNNRKKCKADSAALRSDRARAAVKKKEALVLSWCFTAKQSN